MQRLMSDGENASHIIAAEPTHLKKRDGLLGLIRKVGQQDTVGLIPVLPEIKCLTRLTIVAMDTAIAAHDIGLFRPVALFLAAGTLVIKTVSLFRNDQGE